MNSDLLYDDKTTTIAVKMLNSLFIIIILFLHHIAYTPYYFHFYNIPLFLQKLSVGGFFFLSGYKLSKSKATDSVRDFFINRCFRIYLLYVFGLIIFSYTAYPYMNKGHLPSYQNFILHALCLQSILPNFFGNNYFTLWFFSILFYCYCFFLLTRGIAGKTSLFIIATLLNILCIFLLNKAAHQINLNLFQPDLNIYLIYFSAGIICFHHQKSVRRFDQYYLVLSCFGSISLILFYNFFYSQISYSAFAEFFLIMIGTIPFYPAVFRMVGKWKIPDTLLKISDFISYSSFCVFLFHRSIWSVMAVIWYEKSLYQFTYITIIGTLLIFLFSFCMQRTHDSLSRYLRKS